MTTPTFDHSFALTDAEGRLVDWDAGFATEFAAVADRIAPHALLSELVAAAYPSAPATPASGPGARRFDLVREDGRILRVEETPAESGGSIRSVRDVTAARQAGNVFAQAGDEWRTDGDPNLEAVFQMNITQDGAYVLKNRGPEELRELWGLPDDIDLNDIAAIMSRLVLTPEENARNTAAVALMCQTMAPCWMDTRVRDRDGRLRWIRFAMSAEPEADGGVLITTRQRDVTRETLAADQLQLMRSAVTHAGDAIQIVHTDADGLSTIAYANPAFERTTGWPVEEIVTRPIDAMTGWGEVYWAPVLALAAAGDERSIELEVLRRGGRAVWLEVSAKVVERRVDGAFRWVVVSRNIDQRRMAYRALQAAQSELITVARRAGMAEIATNVLHNVGNVLNSVNVSANLIGSTLRASKSQGLGRAMGLINAEAGNLGEFFTRDERGLRLPGYLNKLVDAMAAEQKAVLDELDALTRSIDHIKDIVATQQAHAAAPNLAEPVRAESLLEDAVRLNAVALERHRVTVTLEIAETPPALLDKARVLQVLVNLIANAKQAMNRSDAGEHRMTLGLSVSHEADGDWLMMSVADDGEGIAPEVLPRIFVHGFTTRKEGHGFGLHGSALAAREMGGSLTVHSDGPGKGAVFTLRIPFVAAGEHA